MATVTIETLDDPRLDPYRNLIRTNLTRWTGQFIAEGRRVVRRLLASDCAVESILVSERKYASLAAELGTETDILVVPQALAEQLVGYKFHFGVLACGIRQPEPGLADIIPPAPARATLVVCPHITGPDNLGSIVRLCAGFGVDGLLLGPGCVDPFSRRALRVSMGCALGLPIVHMADPACTLQSLREQWGFEIAATIISPQAEPLHMAKRAERFAILFGHEAEGLDADLVARCQRKITIPMEHDADTLNVSVAAGIFLHHFSRRV